MGIGRKIVRSFSLIETYHRENILDRQEKSVQRTVRDCLELIALEQQQVSVYGGRCN